jgi:hypothetical protein
LLDDETVAHVSKEQRAQPAGGENDGDDNLPPDGEFGKD